jgi:CBS domain-containing protein
VNVAYFLTPKSDVVWLPVGSTMRQALERMERHRYSAVPLLDEEGKYVATLTEGDLLWKIKATPGLSFEGTEKVRLVDVPRRIDNKAVHIDAHMETLVTLAVDQNFVPVVDSREVFIGIVRRKAILEYCLRFVDGRAGAAPPAAGGDAPR